MKGGSEMTECNHKWVDMEDGSRDKFCVRCGNKAKQAMMSMPITVTISCEPNIEQLVNALHEQIKRNNKINF